MNMSYAQTQEKVADLKNQADCAYASWDRASRHMGANDAECSTLYHAYIAATDAWKAALGGNHATY